MEHPTLQHLSNDCLMHIFKYLELRDFVNFARTNTRHLQLASNMYVSRFSHIRIIFLNRHKSNKEFIEMLEAIGKSVLSIQVERVTREHFLIIETIRGQCKNLTSMTLRMCDKAIHLEDFRNLKELKLFQVKIASTDLRKYFTINQNIESIAWDFSDRDFMELLKMLPKLNSLSLLTFMLPVQLAHYLLNLVGLTKLSFMSTGNCNNLLIVLANKFKLVELNFRSFVNDKTYHIIKSFQYLESLSTDLSCFPKYVTYPPKLKRIEFANRDVSCSALLLLVQQLAVMEEFYLINGEIFWDRDHANMYYSDGSSHNGNYPDSEMFSTIAEKLKKECDERKLKIIYCNTTGNEGNKCIYNSDHLKVIRSSSLLQAPAPVLYSIRD